MTMTLNHPPHLALARTPTPIQDLPKLTAQLGVSLCAKRDDLTGAGLSGNKIRKLEYLLGEAESQGADTIITCGGEQSNHCRATVALASSFLASPCALGVSAGSLATPAAGERDSALPACVSRRS